MSARSRGNPARPRKKSPYEVLGVPHDTSDEEIRKAYRRLALRYHPDKNAEDADAADTFKEINAAHSLLSDPKKRERYDAHGTVDGDDDESEDGDQMPANASQAMGDEIDLLSYMLGLPPGARRVRRHYSQMNPSIIEAKLFTLLQVGRRVEG